MITEKQKEQIIYLDDNNNPTSKERATRVRILEHKEGQRVETYGIIEMPENSPIDLIEKSEVLL